MSTVGVLLRGRFTTALVTLAVIHRDTTSWALREAGEAHRDLPLDGAVVYLPQAVGQTGGRSDHPSTPFSFAEVKPYEVVESLADLHGPEQGVLRLPTESAWGGRTEFDLEDSYDRAAVYKIILEEGTGSHLRELVSGRLLPAIWTHMRPARQVRVLWEQQFPQLRAAV